jgi:hypothetical protein
LQVETGSYLTAHTTTHSRVVCGHFENDSISL